MKVLIFTIVGGVIVSIICDYMFPALGKRIRQISIRIRENNEEHRLNKRKKLEAERNAESDKINKSFRIQECKELIIKLKKQNNLPNSKDRLEVVNIFIELYGDVSLTPQQRLEVNSIKEDLISSCEFLVKSSYVSKREKKIYSNIREKIGEIDKRYSNFWNI